MMINAKIVLLSLLMILLAILFIAAYTVYGTGVITVYGDEYVEKYFQRDKVMDINIEINEADWEYILQNAIEEEFRPAKVTVNGDAYEVVEIRAKGNSSLSSVYRSDSERYSFKLNFGNKGKMANKTMAGLTQLNLNNGFSDPSYMREFLSYQLFEEMEVAVPAFSYAALYVNGEYYGLYLAVESILEPYLERNFGDIAGGLYKSLGNTLEYNGASKSNYFGLEVRSNSKNAVKNNDWSKLIKMLDVLNNGGDDIEKYLDVDAALRYIATSTALANFDSYQGNFAHNYYLYEQNGKFTILPWDLNMSFGGFSFGGSAASVYIDEPTQGPLASRPLIARLLADEEYLEIYHGYLEEIATKYLSSGYLERETARLKDLISDYVRTDPTAFYTYEQFEKSISGTITGGAMGEENQTENVQRPPEETGEVEHKGFQMGGIQGFGGNVPGILEFAAGMSESIHKQLSGELPSTNEGGGMGGGMGMGKGGEWNPGGGRFPLQQRPMVNGERPAPEGGGREQGGMRLPDDRKGGFGPPEGMILPEGAGMDMPEMMADGQGGAAGGREGWGMPGGIPRGEGSAAGNRPLALTYLLLSGVLIMAAIIMILFFKRRRYLKT